MEFRERIDELKAAQVAGCINRTQTEHTGRVPTRARILKVACWCRDFLLSGRQVVEAVVVRDLAERVRFRVRFAQGDRDPRRDREPVVQRFSLGKVATMTIRVGPFEFDHVSYDRAGDVLYLRRGPQERAADTFGTPEGHAVRMDGRGEVIGITIVNAKWLSERDGRLKVTVPSLMDADPGDLARALAAA
jgi:uncharacterized protein YuzE